jgi:magnesium transporter
MTMVVNCVVYNRKTGSKVGDIPIDQVSEALEASPDNFVWVGLHEPDASLMKLVSDEFSLHELAVEDATRMQHRPKIEAYGDTLFVVVRTARLETDDICMGHTYIFVGPRYVLTVRQGASFSYAQVRHRCEMNSKQMRLGPGYILYALLDFVVDNYYPVVEDLGDHLKDLEHRIFGSSFRRDTIKHLYELKHELVRLRLATTPLQDMCSYLMHQTDNTLVPKVIFPYLRDVNDHVLRINDVIDAQSEMLKSAMDVNLAMVSMAQNEIVKKLASWAAILAVPTLVASLYGMNFEKMPELHWAYGYPMALGVMVLGSYALYMRLKKYKWM